MSDHTIHVTHLNDDSISLSGYVHGYDEYQQCGFTERIPSATFAAALTRNPDIALTFDFVGEPIARTRDGTLLLACDKHGLKADAIVEARHENDVADHQFALARRDLDDEWSDAGDRKCRVITVLELCNIGIVEKPPREEGST